MKFDAATSIDQSWARFSNVSVLRKWTEELKGMHGSSCDIKFWRMLGRAVMVAHPIQSEQRKLLELVAREAGLDLVDMDGSKLVEIILGGQTPHIEKPTMFYLGQGAWSKKLVEGETIEPEIAEMRSKLNTYLCNLDPACRLVFVTTGGSYDELDPSLRMAGCVDRRFIIPKPTLEQTGDVFLDLIGLSICGESLLGNAGKVGKLIFEEFDDERRQGLVALAMERIAYKEQRKLEFSDLVHIAVHGSGESEPTPEMDEHMLRRVAVHEAGHALVCFIDSSGRNIPDYISVLPGRQFRGIVADSYAYIESLHGKYAYEDSRHKIRSTLAGRAAEAVVFGAIKVGSFGARADLVNASNWAKELVGACGFPEDIDTAECIGSNLLVTDEEPSTSEQAHVETLARNYLKIQHEYVTNLLNENRRLLEALVNLLMEKPVLFQDDLLSLFSDSPDA